MKTILITLSLFLTYSISHAKVKYEAFTGTFAFVPEASHFSCPVGTWKLESFPESNTLTITEQRTGFIRKIQRIDLEKRTFDSCWSDGIMGHEIVKGKGAQVTDEKVFLKAGFMCRRTRKVERKFTTTWKVKGNQFYIIDEISETKSNYYRKATCLYQQVL